MLVSQMVADKIRVLSVLASARSAVDGRQDLPGLLGDSFARRLLGDLSRQIDGFVVNHDLRHSGPGCRRSIGMGSPEGRE